MVAALASKMKEYSELTEGVNPSDFIAVVPAHWSFEKRKSLKAAIESSGLNCLGITT